MDKKDEIKKCIGAAKAVAVSSGNGTGRVR